MSDNSVIEYFRLWNKTKQQAVLWAYNKFPDGQLQLKLPLDAISTEDKYVLYASIPNSQALDLYNQFDDLTQFIGLNCKKVILYAYGSRCDKYVNDKYHLATFTTMFRGYVTILVPHAETRNVSVHEPAIDDKLKYFHFYNKELVLLDLAKYDLVIFPDQSARDRYPTIAATIKNWVVCEKIRDQETGEIISHSLPEGFSTENILKVLVMDDLCDGGRTFFNIAGLIDLTVPDIDLFVTHGVFSKDALPRLLRTYSHIFTTNSLPWVEDYWKDLSEDQQQRVSVINVWNDYD